MKTLSTFVYIGKSHSKSDYTFLAKDFIRIENDCLILESDNRRLRLDYESKMQLLYQLNTSKDQDFNVNALNFAKSIVSHFNTISYSQERKFTPFEISMWEGAEKLINELG